MSAEASYKISVIIPIYNTQEYLPRCLDSVLTNTYRNIEVICVNDGSTDESLQILKKYAELDDRIVIIDKANEGVSVARNVGLDTAKGEFIAFIDSDDWIDSKYFDVMMSAYEDVESDIVAVGYISATNDTMTVEHFDATPNHQILSSKEALKNGYLKRIVWGRIYRKCSIDEQRFPVNIKWGEDAIFNVGLLSRASKLSVSLITYDGYYYFQRETSACNTLKIREKTAICAFYLNEGIRESDPVRKRIFILECLKQICALRYEADVCGDKESEAELKAMLTLCRKESIKQGTFVEAYLILSYLILSYLIFRSCIVCAE